MWNPFRRQEYYAPPGQEPAGMEDDSDIDLLEYVEDEDENPDSYDLEDIGTTDDDEEDEFLNPDLADAAEEAADMLRQEIAEEDQHQADQIVQEIIDNTPQPVPLESTAESFAELTRRQAELQKQYAPRTVEELPQRENIPTAESDSILQLESRIEKNSNILKALHQDYEARKQGLKELMTSQADQQAIAAARQDMRQAQERIQAKEELVAQLRTELAQARGASRAEEPVESRSMRLHRLQERYDATKSAMEQLVVSGESDPARDSILRQRLQDVRREIDDMEAGKAAAQADYDAGQVQANRVIKQKRTSVDEQLKAYRKQNSRWNRFKRWLRG